VLHPEGEGSHHERHRQHEADETEVEAEPRGGDQAEQTEPWIVAQPACEHLHGDEVAADREPQHYLERQHRTEQRSEHARDRVGEQVRRAEVQLEALDDLGYPSVPALPGGDLRGVLRQVDHREIAEADAVGEQRDAESDADGAKPAVSPKPLERRTKLAHASWVSLFVRKSRDDWRTNVWRRTTNLKFRRGMGSRRPGCLCCRRPG
jgi:hypothetical protein